MENFMKKILMLCTLLVFLTACDNEYDDSGLIHRVDNLENRLAKLEEFCQQMNTNISALQVLVEAMETGDYITGITPILKEGKEVGYTLTFVKHTPITIYHGKAGEDGQDGADGNSPVIGVKEDADGRYYWTLNGEWLLDAKGQKVCANGADGLPGEQGPEGEPGQQGEQGKPGITPKLKIENNHWWVSYDEGKSWVDLGKAVADGGGSSSPADAIFSKVTVKDSEIVFELHDGGTFFIPLYRKVSIQFAAEEHGIKAGATIRIPYTLTNATSQTKVTASSDGNYTVKIVDKDEHSGTLVVKAPEEYTDGYINVLVSDGAYSSLEVIRFYEWEVSISGESQNTSPTYLINSSGKNIEVPVAVNFDYQIEIPAEAQSWVSAEVVNVRAVQHKDNIVFKVKPNTENTARSCRVRMVPANSEEAVVEFVIEQASVYFTIDKSDIVADYQSESIVSKFECTSPVKVVIDEGADWVTYELNQKAENQYELLFHVDANPNDGIRTVDIKIYTFDGKTLLATIRFLQLGLPSDAKDDLVLQVSANVANDFTVHLPLAGTIDCVIDWGDGTKEPVKKEIGILDTQRPSHTYGGLNKPTDFTVRISGKVTRLDCYGIPNVEKKHTITSIVQWGNIGLESLRRSFSGYTSLKSVPADTRGAFAKVLAMNSCFGGCENLEIIDPDFLVYAQQCTDMSGLFYGCTKIKSIPEGLFRNCHKLTDMQSVFGSCSSLSTLPTQLFASCRLVKNVNRLFSGCTSLASIPSDLFSNQTEVRSFDEVFAYCERLSEIPEGLFDACSKVTSFHSTFRNCSLLKVIPEGLFANCPKVTCYDYVFFVCDHLEAIPESLFAVGKEVTSMVGAFGSCDVLTMIPDNLFANCGKLISCYSAFQGCNLKTIPANLFANCPELANIQNIFSYNENLEAIPSSLFANNVKLTDVSWAFTGCKNVTGESPYNWLDGRKVHLYERKNYPLHFKELDARGVFNGCTKLDDYASMPSDYK